jgi:hypothetical protein
VKELALQVDAMLNKIQTGPFASRFQKFLSGDVGSSNPLFRTYMGKADLLSSLLMNMHVGARGGEYFAKKFESMIGAGKQSADNMHATLQDVIIPYTDIVLHSKVGDSVNAPDENQSYGTGGAPPPGSPAGTVVHSATDFLAQ